VQGRIGRSVTTPATWISGLPQASAKAQSYTDAWLMTSSERDDDSYYPGTLRLVYMLLLSNTFPGGC
jgi:hypothetical protein